MTRGGRALGTFATREAQRDTIAVENSTIHKLVQLRGIGPMIATVLAREVFYRKFANRRQVAGYADARGKSR